MKKFEKNRISVKIYESNDDQKVHQTQKIFDEENIQGISRFLFQYKPRKGYEIFRIEIEDLAKLV